MLYRLHSMKVISSKQQQKWKRDKNQKVKHLKRWQQMASCFSFLSKVWMQNNSNYYYWAQICLQKWCAIKKIDAHTNFRTIYLQMQCKSWNIRHVQLNKLDFFLLCNLADSNGQAQADAMVRKQDADSNGYRILLYIWINASKSVLQELPFIQHLFKNSIYNCVTKKWQNPTLKS